MTFSSSDVERKEIAILRIIADSQDPVGARVIAHHLKERGYELGERAVRYHLKIMDERGLTRLVGKRDGRTLTDKGLAEVNMAMVKDKVGFAISRIESLSFRTGFDPRTRRGTVPVNVSLYPREDFERALKAMRPAFENGLCTSRLVALASEGKQLGEVTVPAGKMGLATVCSLIFNGVLLKAGVPMHSRFAGILQLRNLQAHRFVEIIDYAGCSLDPSTVFIKAGMTSVGNAINGNGAVLASFREIPSICHSVAEKAFHDLDQAGFHGVVIIGETGESVCEIPVGLNKIGMVVLGGLNPVALAGEAGIAAVNLPMSTVMEYSDLVEYRDAVIDFRDLVKFWKLSL